MLGIVSILMADIIKIPENYREIQRGINAASLGDTILIADGIYHESINFKGKPLTVASYFFIDGDTTHISKTILDGSKTSHGDSGSVVYFTAGEDTGSILYGLTIAGGSGTKIPRLKVRIGGGILGFNATPRLSFNHIEYNTITTSDTAIGGGVAIWADDVSCPAILEGNLIRQNRIFGTRFSIGGGIFLRSNGRVFNNAVTANSAFSDYYEAIPGIWGGGIACISTNGMKRNFNIITNNIISSNQIKNDDCTNFCIAYGAGIFVRYSNVIIENNLISRNEVSCFCGRFWGVGLALQYVDNMSIIKGNKILSNFYGAGNCEGGGVFIYSAAPLVINNIIAYNSAHIGAGISVNHSRARMINNTIVKNHAQDAGGGFCGHLRSYPLIMNSIIWGNTAPKDTAVTISTLDTLEIIHSNIQGGFDGPGNFNMNPQFSDTLFHLAEDSPCLGKGIIAYKFGDIWCDSPDCDIEGNPRPNPSFSNPDIGAFEEAWGEMTKINVIDKNTPTISIRLLNYPNPFNNSTTIEFSIPECSFLKLKVYNFLGEEVRTILSGKFSAGIYQYNLDASDLASGVYYCQLNADGVTQNKKMILLR